jgi:hypothetical protein
MPNIKGNTNYNNATIRAKVKKQKINISGQVIQSLTTINSNIRTDTPLINSVLLSNSDYIGANPKQEKSFIKTDVQSYGNATTTKKGIARIATTEEVILGEDNSTIVTPFTLKNTVVSDKHYTHNQAIASNNWIINHNLNKKPSISVVDSANTIITGFKAEYVDLNTVIISFNGGFTGKAYLN